MRNGERLAPELRRSAVFLAAVAKELGGRINLDGISRPSLKDIRDAASEEYFQRYGNSVRTVARELARITDLHSRYDKDPLSIDIQGSAVTLRIKLDPEKAKEKAEKAEAARASKELGRGRPGHTSTDAFEAFAAAKSLPVDEAEAERLAAEALDLAEIIASGSDIRAPRIRRRIQAAGGVIEFSRRDEIKRIGRLSPYVGLAYEALAYERKRSRLAPLDGLGALDAFTKVWTYADQAERGRYGKRIDGEPVHPGFQYVEVNALEDGQERLYVETVAGERRGKISKIESRPA